MKRLLLLLMPAVALMAAAQRPVTHQQALRDSIIHQNRTIVIDGNDKSADSIRALMDHFYADQFRHVQDPAAPYFMFLSRNANLAMGIGGEVTFLGWYGWNGAVPGMDFRPYSIPIHPAPGDIRELGATAAATKLFLRAMGRSARLGNYSLYVEGQFSGYNNSGFRLKKAYASLNDWTAGLATTTFSDPGALPPTVDDQGPNNKIDNSAILVRWMHTWHRHWTFAASVEYPATTLMSNSDYAVRCREWAPDLGLFLQYQWAGVGVQHVRLSATTRQLTYRNLVRNKTENVVGWGLQLSAMASPMRQLTLYATLNGGRGVAALIGDTALGDFDLVAKHGDLGEMYAPYVMGCMVSAQYNFSPKLFVDLMYSHMHFYPRKGIPGDTYCYGDVGSANFFYYITPRVRTGLGFNVGRRANVDGEKRTAFRVGMIAALAF